LKYEFLTFCPHYSYLIPHKKMPFAARVGDNHICPASTGTVAHVGGPLLPPGVPNVFIGKKPAAVAQGQCTCAGGPAMIARGSSNVFINKKQAARMGDPTSHGGKIATGCPNVSIGG
jgi:uncharacterized Zn-binding protein involved in type VI secretion